MKNRAGRPIDSPSAAARWWPGALIAMLLSLAFASVPLAQPALLRSEPSMEASVPAPPKLVLTFNGRVVVHLSSVMLVGGPRNTRVLLSSREGPDAGYARLRVAPAGARPVSGRVESACRRRAAD